MDTKQTGLPAQTRCIITALVLGVAMFGATLVIERASVGQGSQMVAASGFSNTLSAKKTCIMLAWQQQSGALDRAQCAEYREQWDARQQAVAHNR